MTQEPGTTQGRFTAAETGMVRRAPVTDLLVVEQLGNGESAAMISGSNVSNCWAFSISC